MSNYLDSAYTALNNLLNISAEYLYTNTATINTLTVVKTLIFPLSYVWTNLINQSELLTGTNQMVKTNFQNNVTQSSGSNQLLDTSIGSITQADKSVIVQSGTEWNQLKQTQVTDLSITGVLTLPSDIIVSGSTHNDDLVLNNATIQQTITNGNINTLGATDFYNGDVRLNNNLVMNNCHT